MPKKLAIFCDGTWNDLRAGAATNVVRLAKSVAPNAADGTAQIVYYDEGVGVASNVSYVADTITKYIGGALGRGLDRKIEAAYRFLVVNYEPGDDIYVFGFSRGAYTARSLCGLIRKCGILKRSCFNRVPDALKLYRDPRHPASPEVQSFRAQFAHPVATGEEDHGSLRMAPADRSPATRAELFQYRPEPSYRIMYVGIWDTVSAMGIPPRFDIFRFNRRYAFHDTNASSLIASLRHAVAANEKRGLFDITPFDNIDALNRAWARATGWDMDDAAAARHVPYPLRPYQQRWFPGDHASVGGGYVAAGLSSCALLWIAEGARWAGLGLIEPNGAGDDELGPAGRGCDPCAGLGGNGTGGMPSGARRRRGPELLDEIADPTWQRYVRDAAYDPPNLTVLKGRPREAPPASVAPPGYPAA